MILRVASNASLMTDAHGWTPLNFAVFWFSTANVLREILHIRPVSALIRVRNGAGGERLAGGQGQTALELLCEFQD